MASKQAERVVSDARSRTEQDDGNRLVRNLVVSGREVTVANGHESQTAVLYAKSSPVKPDQSVAIGMRHSRLFQSETSCQHGAV